MSDGERTGLSRTQYLLGTALVALAGMTLVSGLAVVFAREGATPDDGPTRTLAFAGDDTGLEVVSGAVATEEGHLVATEAGPDDPAVGLVDARTEEGRLVVTAVDPAPGWGVVFRWTDGDDHWFASTAEADGPLRLGLVHDGETEVVDTAPSPLEAGAEVEVRFDANRADLRIDGVLVASARGRQGDGRRVGVWAAEAGAAWDDLVLGPRPTPVVREDR